MKKNLRAAAGARYHSPPQRRGAIAQLGERLHGMQEVAGSIPAGSTNFGQTGLSGSPTKSASPSSRGLGHYPFTVATGVRIPVGTPSLSRTRAWPGFLVCGRRWRHGPQRLVRPLFPMRQIAVMIGGSQHRGAIAQLGERLHGMQEVAGSIPAGSTNFGQEACPDGNRSMRPHRLEA